MKVLYYDCFAGISGDMNLGALVDLGVDENYLIDMLNKLPMNNEFHIKVSKKQKMGIEGTKVDVILENEHHHDHSNEHHHHEHNHDHSNEHHHHDHTHNHSDKHSHDHSHKHDGEHTHNENHHHTHTHDHEHRNLESIRKIINQSDLNNNIKELSLNMFMEVAKAEAMVHG
jgi:uncharacterized protein (DUF111 family)